MPIDLESIPVTITITPDLSSDPATYDFIFQRDVGLADTSVLASNPWRIYRQGYDGTYDSGRIPSSYDGSHTTITYQASGIAEEILEGNWITEITYQDDSKSTIDHIIDQSTIYGLSPSGQTTISPQSNEFSVKIPKADSPYRHSEAVVGPIGVVLGQYGETRTWTSDPYSSEAGLSMLSLYAYDVVPFNTGSREDWLKYEIVTGAEHTYPITPVNRPGQFPIVYHINSPLPEDIKEERQTLFGEGFIEHEVTSWAVRIIINRPGALSSMTPVVYKYRMRYSEQN